MPMIKSSSSTIWCTTGSRPLPKLKKILNPGQEKKLNAARKRCFRDFRSLKFHGTGRTGIEHIPREGFRFPTHSTGRPSMFDPSINFATDSSKSARDTYTKITNKLLLCDVLLGKAKTVISGDSSLTLKNFWSEGFDSILAPRDTKASGGVLNNEYIIYVRFEPVLMS